MWLCQEAHVPTTWLTPIHTPSPCFKLASVCQDVGCCSTLYIESSESSEFAFTHFYQRKCSSNVQRCYFPRLTGLNILKHFNFSYWFVSLSLSGLKIKNISFWECFLNKVKKKTHYWMDIWEQNDLVYHTLLSQCIIHTYTPWNTHNETHTHTTEAVNKHTHA